jgi:hypothetical protein
MCKINKVTLQVQVIVNMFYKMDFVILQKITMRNTVSASCANNCFRFFRSDFETIPVLVI